MTETPEFAKCKLCRGTYELAEFRLKSTGRRNTSCNKCCDRAKAVFHDHNTKHDKKYYKMTVERQQRDRKYAIHRYGAVCACCGEDNPRFLTFDHKNQDGAEHRREMGEIHGGHAIVRWLIKNNFPPTIQLLCFNCNCAKGANRSCPHEEFDWMSMAGIGATPQRVEVAI